MFKKYVYWLAIIFLLLGTGCDIDGEGEARIDNLLPKGFIKVKVTVRHNKQSGTHDGVHPACIDCVVTQGLLNGLPTTCTTKICSEGPPGAHYEIECSDPLL